MNYKQMQLREREVVSQSQHHLKEDEFAAGRGNLKSQDAYGKNNEQEFEQQPVKSAADLGFMTEVDVDYPKAPKTRDETDELAGTTTRMSDGEYGSMPQNMSTILDMENEKEEIAFKNVIKELVSKDQQNALQLEDRILGKLKKQNLSRGWVRPTGVKVAPLKILQSLHY